VLFISLQCKDNKCVKGASCTAGTEGCECKADGTCDTGLECKDNKCVKAQPTASGLFIKDQTVRACDLVYKVADLKATFGQGVKGVVKHKGGRTAVSFIAAVDKAFDGAVLTLTDGNGAKLKVLPDTVECYDRAGKAVAEPGLEMK
jgi:hypothetical protein